MSHLKFVALKFGKIQYLINRQRSRRQLLVLDKSALNDIGITRNEALEEASKPFWR